MRKSFDGLSGVVRNELGRDPMDGEVYIFLNRQRSLVNLLVWDWSGWAIWSKRLERGSYELPRTKSEGVSLSWSELEKIRELLEHYNLTLTPKNPLAVAAAYSLKRWVKLTLYTLNGELEIDNNPVENAIRPVALGRKNYLFAGSHDSAQRAAAAYTMLAACKATEINPLDYLADMLQTLPTRDINNVDDLLPHQWAVKNSAVENNG